MASTNLPRASRRADGMPGRAFDDAGGIGDEQSLNVAGGQVEAAVRFVAFAQRGEPPMRAHIVGTRSVMTVARITATPCPQSISHALNRAVAGDAVAVEVDGAHLTKSPEKGSLAAGVNLGDLITDTSLLRGEI